MRPSNSLILIDNALILFRKLTPSPASQLVPTSNALIVQASLKASPKVIKPLAPVSAFEPVRTTDAATTSCDLQL
jgi:hypothetical protein